MNIDSVNSKPMPTNVPTQQQTIQPGVAKGFEDLFGKATKVKEEKGTETKINQMFQTIDDLKKTMETQGITVDNLNQYKEAVKQFLSEYTQNKLKMEDYYLNDRKGYKQKLSMIRSVDSQLDNLTENMLETNQGHLSMLNKIGDIHGLIVNKFM